MYGFKAVCCRQADTKLRRESLSAGVKGGMVSSQAGVVAASPTAPDDVDDDDDAAAAFSCCRVRELLALL